MKVGSATAASQIEDADILILPGVGAFNSCWSAISRAGLAEPLRTATAERTKPTLGICVGMHLMATSSSEHGYHRGFGWIDGHVSRIEPSDYLVVPHVGWNVVEGLDRNHPISSACHGRSYYFNHSYAFDYNTQSSKATTEYGGPICAVVAQDNLVGVQFHPEKSQVNGLRFFRQFFKWAQSW